MPNYDDLTASEASDIIARVKGGQPPAPEHIPYVRVGREKEERQLCDDPVSGMQSVKNGNGDMFFVLGDFGYGKSFFINLIENRAREMNFLTTQIDIADIKSISNEVEIYCDIVRALRYPDDPGTGLAPLLRKFIEQTSPDELDAFADRYGLTGHPFTRILRNVLEAEIKGTTHVKRDDVSLNYREVISAAVAYMSGNDISLPEKHAIGKKGFDKVGQEKQWTYLEGIRSMALELGYSGILISIDEVAEEMDWSPDNQTTTTLINLYNKCYSSDFDNLMFIFVGNKGRWDGLIDETGHQALADRYHAKRVSLDSLTRRDYEELVEKIARLTEIAYDQEIRLSESDKEEIVQTAEDVHGELNELSPRGLLLHPRDKSDESPDLVEFFLENCST